MPCNLPTLPFEIDRSITIDVLDTPILDSCIKKVEKNKTTGRNFIKGKFRPSFSKCVILIMDA